MSKFVVIVFPTEAKAYEGTRVLQSLHGEGSITLYGASVVEKDAKGKVSVKEAGDEGPVGTALGALVGALVGVVGGPVGVAVGAMGGTAIGSLLDLLNLGVGADFVQKVSTELGAGKTAVIAEITESWTTPLDVRMESLGGTVLRTWRADFEDDQLAKEMADRKAELEALRSEVAEANAATKEKLNAKLDQAKANFKKAEAKVQNRLDELEKEGDAKIAALGKQVTEAKAAAKEKIRARIAAVRADYERRSAKLKQAWAITKEALAA